MKKIIASLLLTTLSTHCFADNDRCDRQVEKITGGKYSMNLSSVDLLNLASGAPLNLGYKDLDASETSCIAKAIYKSDPTKKGATLIAIKLHDKPLPMESYVKELNYQWCFNQLYNNALDNGRNSLSPSELDHFRNQFETICMTGKA